MYKIGNNTQFIVHNAWKDIASYNSINKFFQLKNQQASLPVSGVVKGIVTVIVFDFRLSSSIQQDSYNLLVTLM